MPPAITYNKGTWVDAAQGVDAWQPLQRAGWLRRIRMPGSAATPYRASGAQGGALKEEVAK